MDSWLLLVPVVGIAAFYGGRALVRQRQYRQLEAGWRAAEEQRKTWAPVEHALDTFVWKERASSWCATANAGGREVQVAVLDCSPAHLVEALDRHRAFASATLADDTALRLVAASQVLDLYNRTWREGGAVLDVETLAKAFELRRIRLPADEAYGPYLLFRAERWTFGGHWIELALDASYAPRPDSAHPTEERC